MVGRIWIILALFGYFLSVGALPQGFVYLHDVDPTIQQDMRYAGAHNFVGRPVDGYQAPVCILTKPTAIALSQVQRELWASGLSLKVYDCYRPQRAVDEFIAWSQQPSLLQTRAEFYPRTPKSQVFALGYVASRSGHSRGSTVDLTIMPITAIGVTYPNPRHLVSCFAPYQERFQDGGLDMGTGFDCLDELAHTESKDVNLVAQYHRHLLKALMEKYGFEPYDKEWWHFTLKHEPYPNTYFDFVVDNSSAPSWK